MMPANLFAYFSNIQNFSSIDSILDSPAVTIEQILDDESAVSALNSGNLKLVEYFNNERLEILIKFALQYPPEGSDDKRSHKYPFIATEILCCNSSLLTDKLFESQNLIEKIFVFLDSEGNPLQAGYFARIFLHLLSSGTKILLYLLTHLKYFCKLADFVEFKSICEVIEKIIILDYSIEESFVKQRIELLKKVLSQIKESKKKSKNAAQIAVNIFSYPGEINAASSLFEVLYSDETLDLIFSQAFSEECLSLPIIKAFFSSSFAKQSGSGAKSLDLRLVQSAPKIVQVLNGNRDVAKNTLQEEYKPLGLAKLNVVQVVTLALQSGSESFKDIILKSEVLQSVIKLFWQLDWNSFLHIQMLTLAESILSGPFLDLKIHFCFNCNFIQESIKNLLSNPRQSSGRPDLRPGYDGTLYKILGSISKLSKNCEEFTQRLSSVKDWQLCESLLAKRTFTEGRELGSFPISPISDILIPQEESIPDIEENFQDIDLSPPGTFANSLSGKKDFESVDSLYWRF